MRKGCTPTYSLIPISSILSIAINTTIAALVRWRRGWWLVVLWEIVRIVRTLLLLLLLLLILIAMLVWVLCIRILWWILRILRVLRIRLPLVQVRLPWVVILLLLLLHNRIGVHRSGGGGFLQQHGNVVGQHLVHLVDHVLVQLLEVGDVFDLAQHLAILIHIGEVTYSSDTNTHTYTHTYINQVIYIMFIIT